MTSQPQAAWGTISRSELHELADRFGTPYFLYDADAVLSRLGRVRNALAGEAEIYFAVKANPNLALLEALRASAAGLDISSLGELEQAIRAGFDPMQLSFAGPGKSEDEIRHSVERGVGCISVESIRELNACVEAARSVGRRANVSLRVNPLHQNRAFGMKMGGRPVQFGIDEEDLPSAIAVVQHHIAGLSFRGVHVYAGSQCFDVAGLVEGVADSLRIAVEVEERLGQRCSVVNLGGGFGVSHAADGRELDVAAAGRELIPIIRAFRERSAGACRIVFELGRYLAAEAGLYVCRVLSRKASRGKVFYVVDGGLHHHLAAAGTFGAALRSNFPLENLTRPDAPLAVCSIAGPSCNPTDLLGVEVQLASAQEGDLVGVFKSGSYGLTASPVLFLGRPTAIELVRVQSRVVVGRQRHNMADFN